MRKHDLAVTGWVSLAIMAASIEPIVAKLGYASNLTPLQLIALKCIFGALFILPLTRKWRWIGLSGLQKMLGVSMLLLVTHGLTLLSLQTLPAVIVITVVTVTPALVGCLNQALGRDQLGPKFWLGFALCAGGILLGLDLKEASFNALGLLEIFGAVITSTIYRVQMEDTTEQYSPSLVSTYIFLINGLTAALFIFPFATPIPNSAWATGCWMGLAAAAANVAFLYALNLLGSTRVSIINMLQRPIIIIAAALILKESLTALQVAGILMVLSGIQLATVKRLKTSERAEFTEPTVPAPAFARASELSNLENTQ